jgi:hypothetical protein
MTEVVSVHRKGEGACKSQVFFGASQHVQVQDRLDVGPAKKEKRKRRGVMEFFLKKVEGTTLS